jgi:hypothetical protein
MCKNVGSSRSLHFKKFSVTSDTSGKGVNIAARAAVATYLKARSIANNAFLAGKHGILSFARASRLTDSVMMRVRLPQSDLMLWKSRAIVTFSEV